MNGFYLLEQPRPIRKHIVPPLGKLRIDQMTLIGGP